MRVWRSEIHYLLIRYDGLITMSSVTLPVCWEVYLCDPLGDVTDVTDVE
jgi:hypothetical protein